MTYIVDKDLLAASRPITIDFTSMGIKVSGNLGADDGNRSCAC